MKLVTRRLVILDIIVALVCAMQFARGVAPCMQTAVLTAQLVLFAYGLWFLLRMRGMLPAIRR